MTKDIFSNESLRDWLEARDPSEEYDYSKTKGCILYQYFKDAMPETTGVTPEAVVAAADDRSWRRQWSLPPHWNNIAKREPWTVEAVLDRLGEVLGVL